MLAGNIPSDLKYEALSGTKLYQDKIIRVRFPTELFNPCISISVY